MAHGVKVDGVHRRGMFRYYNEGKAMDASFHVQFARLTDHEVYIVATAELRCCICSI